MIEWQAESGLFTVRIRGKQWYWIYKFELKTLTDILSVPKNLGRNKWVVYTPGDIQVADDYLHILQLRAQNKWVHNYWGKELGKNTKADGFYLTSPFENLSTNLFKEDCTYKNLSFYNSKSLFLNLKYNSSKKNLYGDAFVNFIVRLDNKKSSWLKKLVSTDMVDSRYPSIILNDSAFFNSRKDQYTARSVIYKELSFRKEFEKSYRFFSDQLDTSRWFKRATGSLSPMRFLKLPVDSKELEFDGNILRVRFSENTESIVHKPLPHSVFLAMKQKRYKRRKIILPRYKYDRLDTYKLDTKSPWFSVNNLLVNNQIVKESDLENTIQYNYLKKKKNRSENTSVILSRRILRTKRTLVLPAHVNLTAVTNSYDVIHSWFIPGLGLKMDCIPGRSTHHTFHIDNVGFYYGQCAEVCGRFHHHMPIRICALPFEHFLIWWHSFGLPKLMFSVPKRSYQTYYGFRKFVW